MAANRTKAVVIIASRIFVCCLGIVTIAWGCYAISIAWRQSGIAQIADHVIAGDPFKANVFTALALQLDVSEPDKWGHPSAIRNAAVIRLRILENTIADGDPKNVDTQMAQLH